MNDNDSKLRIVCAMQTSIAEYCGRANALLQRGYTCTHFVPIHYIGINKDGTETNEIAFFGQFIKADD